MHSLSNGAYLYPHTLSAGRKTGPPLLSERNIPQFVYQKLQKQLKLQKLLKPQKLQKLLSLEKQLKKKRRQIIPRQQRLQLSPVPLLLPLPTMLR